MKKIKIIFITLILISFSCQSIWIKNKSGVDLAVYMASQDNFQAIKLLKDDPYKLLINPTPIEHLIICDLNVKKCQKLTNINASTLYSDRIIRIVDGKFLLIYDDTSTRSDRLRLVSEGEQPGVFPDDTDPLWDQILFTDYGSLKFAPQTKKTSISLEDEPKYYSISNEIGQGINLLVVTQNNIHFFEMFPNETIYLSKIEEKSILHLIVCGKISVSCQNLINIHMPSIFDRISLKKEAQDIKAIFRSSRFSRYKTFNNTVFAPGINYPIQPKIEWQGGGFRIEFFHS